MQRLNMAVDGDAVLFSILSVSCNSRRTSLLRWADRHHIAPMQIPSPNSTAIVCARTSAPSRRCGANAPVRRIIFGWMRDGSLSCATISPNTTVNRPRLPQLRFSLARHQRFATFLGRHRACPLPLRSAPTPT